MDARLPFALQKLKQTFAATEVDSAGLLFVAAHDKLTADLFIDNNSPHFCTNRLLIIGGISKIN